MTNKKLARSRASILLARDNNQLLPDVAAGEEADEGGWSALQPFRDVLQIDNLPLSDVLGHPVLKFPVLVVMIEDDESLQPDPLGNQVKQIVDALGLLQVVLGDHPAHRDAPIQSHVRENGVEHRPADVLEVDVDALREVPETAVFQFDDQKTLPV